MLSDVYGDYKSPYNSNAYLWNVLYPFSIESGEKYYMVWSIDCTKVYNSSTTSKLADYEGDFYNIKIFINGEFLYDTYYSTAHYDSLKDNQDIWNLKYFTIGRTSSGNDGWWDYSKMQTYCMRLYNKGLTTDEIVDNYNVTKAYYSAIIN